MSTDAAVAEARELVREYVAYEKMSAPTMWRLGDLTAENTAKHGEIGNGRGVEMMDHHLYSFADWAKQIDWSATGHADSTLLKYAREARAWPVKLRVAGAGFHAHQEARAKHKDVRVASRELAKVVKKGEAFTKRPRKAEATVEDVQAKLRDDPEFADAVMADRKVRMRTAAAAGKHKAAAESSFKSERRAAGKGAPQEVVDGLQLGRIGGALGRIVRATRDAAEAWKEVEPLLSEEATEVALHLIASEQGRVDMILDAMRGNDLDAALAKILAEGDES